MTKRQGEGISSSEKRVHLAITADEAKLYDRQIRLWGLEAQSRMRNSRILCIGVTSLSNEVLKNIILAGVGHVSIMDAEKVKKADLSAQFLLREEDIGKNRAASVVPRLQLLNPRVDIRSVEGANIESKDEEFFRGFDLVVMTSGTPSERLFVNEICHADGIKFWSAANHGFYSYIFSDLVSHTFTIETKKSGMEGESLIKEEKTEEFCTLKKTLSATFDFADTKSKGFNRRWNRTASPLYFALNVVWRYWLKHKKYPTLKDKVALEEEYKEYLGEAKVHESMVPFALVSDLVKSWGLHVSAPSAILGGFLGQEVLKVLSKKEVPFNNFFLHDAMEASGFRMKVN